MSVDCGDLSAVGARTAVQFADETCWGDEAARAQVTKGVELRSESIVGEIGALVSEVLRPDRAIHKRVQGTVAVAGDVVVELSNDGFLTLLKNAIGKYDQTGTRYQVRPLDSTDSPAYGLPPGMTFYVGRDAGTIADNMGLPGDVYFKYVGMKVNSLNIVANPNEIVTSTFNLMGKSETVSDGSDTLPTATYGVNDPFTGFQGGLTIDGTSSDVLGFNVTLNNNLATDKFYLGSRYRGSLPEQSKTVEGTISTEFKNTDMYNDFQNGTSAILRVKFDASPSGSPDTEWLEVILPKIEYNGFPVNATSKEAIVVEVPFVGLWDDSEGYDMGIDIETAQTPV